MKKCKSCQSEIDDKAKKCPHCQTDQRNWFIRHKIISAFLVIFLIIIISAIANSGSSTSGKSVAAPNESGNKTVATTSKPTATPTPATLLDISGSGTKSTEKFTAGGDWTLNYSYDCSNFGSQGNFQVMVYNSDGSMSTNTPVNELGTKGSDTEYYHQSGSYYLEVNSECSWRVQVKG